MAGPPKSRGMIMYVLKNMMDSFKVDSLNQCSYFSDVGAVLQKDLSTTCVLRMFLPGWKKGEGGDPDGERPFWQLLLRAASPASGPNLINQSNPEVKEGRF